MDIKPTVQELELKVKELTAKLEAALQFRDIFINNISHEIRTPLNGVIAASDLALSEKPSSKVEQYLKLIHTSGSSLLEVVNNILDYSKIESGELALDPMPFRIDDVLDSLTERYVNKAYKKGIELLVDIEPNIPKALTGDSIRLKQVLGQLLERVIQLSCKGGVITIGIRKVEVSISFVRYQFYIKDTVFEIDPNLAHKLINPFSQASPSAAHEYEPTGLGIHIAGKIVELMGGQINLQSKPGNGSEFHFTARFDRQALNQEEKYIFPKGLEALNVLIVDDCTDSRSILKKMLHSFGFQSQESTTGFEALTQIKNRPQEEQFDIIIMDWKMAGIDGIETSKMIRKNFNQSIPIILLTAVGREKEKLKAEQLGLEAFLTKPVNAPLLFNTIIDVLGKEALESEKQKKHIATKASIYKKRLLGIRVLLAEDNPTSQDIALAVLEQAGVHVEIANNGREAVELAKKKRFDAVLMDIQMPHMDGLEATRRIREDKDISDLPIIAMTAHAMKGDEIQCKKAGMDGYITKPINQEVLFYTLWKNVKFKESTKPCRKKPKQPENNHYLPEILPGIDIRAALKMLNIDKSTFRRILLRFYDNHKNYAEKLCHAFENKDWTMLRSLSHSIKGSGGNIGAYNLRQAAQQLEATDDQAMITVGKSHVEQLLSALKQVMDSLILLADISPLPENKTFMANPQLDISYISSLMTELKSAIAVADPDKTKRYFGVVKKQLGASAVEDLENNLDVYEYDEAIETLKKIARTIGVNV